MRVYRSLEEVPPDFGPSALTIGNFDGVHFGHRRILRRVCAVAQEHGWKASVLTFDPHPTRVVAPERAPRLMTSLDQRVELMAAEGVEQVMILPFTRERANLTAEEFIQSIVVDRLGARAVLVGHNFRFGCKQTGNVRLLQQLGQRFGFETVIVPAVGWRGHAVSSSGIRKLILEGRVSLAARHLQHPYAIEGEVRSGHGVGAKRTVPTLNLATTAEVLPERGVYITRTCDLESAREWNSITNIGYRPTFGASEELSIETYLLDPFDGVAPGRIRVEFLRRVREERRFENPEALRTQIMKDARAAQNYFRRTKSWIGRVPCISS